MSFALTPERDLGLGISGHLEVEPEIRISVVSKDVVPISLGPVFGGGNVIWGATPVAQLGNGAIIYQDDEAIRGVTTAEIFSKVKSDSSGPLDFLQAGIVGLIASPIEIRGHPLNPIYCFGEAAAARIFSMKKKALENSLGRIAGVAEVESKSLSEVFPKGSKAVNILLALSLLAGTGLGVPTGNGNGKSGGVDGGGRGPDFSKILHWVLPIGGGITIETLLSACARAIGLPGPAVTVVTEMPPVKLTPTETPRSTHTPTLAPPTPTPTETPFFGAGGSELPAGSPDQAQALLDLKMQLPSADCISSPNNGGNQQAWDNRIKALAEQGASAIAIADLQTRISSKLESQQLNTSTSLELCVGEGWGLVVRDNTSKLLWWPFDQEENKFADRPDRWLGEGNWEFRQIPKQGLRDGLGVEISLINGWPLAVAMDKDNKPIQYFDTVLGEFRDFRWNPLAGTDKLIIQFSWSGIDGARILSDGSLKVSGFNGIDGGLVVNRNIQMVDIKGDFSFGAKFAVEAGVGGGLSFIDRDPAGLQNWWEARKLDIIVNRESNGQGGLWIGYRDFSQDPVTLLNENSLPPQINGQDVVEVKFRPGTNGITVIINGSELDTVTAAGLLQNAKLLPGVSAGQNAENTVSEFFVNVPVGGQDNVRLEGMLPESTATSIATATATQPAPELTPGPTAISATRIPTDIPTSTLIPSPTALPALPCDQRGGPENACLTHICFISDYTEDFYGNSGFYEKGTNMWAVEWYAQMILASGAAVVGDCP